jgi:biopolymer transport protein ExbB
MGDKTTDMRAFLRVGFLAAALIGVGAVMFAALRQGTSGQALGAQTFLEQFVVSGGPIVWLILMPGSVWMVYLAAQYALTIRRKVLLPARGGAEMVESAGHLSGREFAEALAGNGDMVSTAVCRALSQGTSDWFRMRSACFESVQEQAMVLARRIEWLNLIGNVSPMVGLFGTVFGMIKLFDAIVSAGGQPAPAQLAAGISVALVTTFWGLAVAIPALALYGVFRNRIETLANEALATAEDILPKIRKRLLAQQAAAGQGAARIQAMAAKKPVRQAVGEVT